MRTGITSCVLDLFWRWGIRSGATSFEGLSTSTSISTEPLPSATGREILYLRSILRRAPTWAGGHLQLAERSLILDDVACAYASAHAALACDGVARSIREAAWFVLGRCYLRRGMCERSLSFLTRAAELQGRETEVKEEIAAAVLLQGDRKEALRILEGLPSTKLSPAGAAALQFLRAKELGARAQE